MALEHHLTHASLFSGIGGFDLAAEWAGFKNIFHCDYDDFCRQALEHHFPNSDSYADITNTDFTKYKGQISVMSGGFPCQPFSLAGKRKGANDSRYLWPQMLRAIREIRPTWVVGENVIGITSMVLPSENIPLDEQATTCQESDFVIEQICRDLESAGYSIQPFIIPACSIGAPHKRDRVWIIAHLTTDTSSERCHNGSDNRQRGYLPHNINRNASQDKSQRCRWECRVGSSNEDMGLVTNSYCNRCHERWGDNHLEEQISSERSEVLCNAQRSCKEWSTANTRCKRYERRLNKNRPKETIQLCSSGLSSRSSDEQRRIPTWQEFPTQPPLYLGDDGIPLWLADTPLSHKKWRQLAVKACGNAIVPQVAYEILRHISEVELSVTVNR